jgi:hypothetical protein
MISTIYYNMNLTNNHSYKIAAAKVFSDLYALIKKMANHINLTYQKCQTIL